MHREELGRLQCLVQNLGPGERELIVLRFDAELSMAEIARVIGTSKATIQRRMARLLQTLKEDYNA